MGEREVSLENEIQSILQKLSDINDEVTAVEQNLPANL